MLPLEWLVPEKSSLKNALILPMVLFPRLFLSGEIVNSTPNSQKNSKRDFFEPFRAKSFAIAIGVQEELRRPLLHGAIRERP